MSPAAGIRLIVGADEAGVDYKDQILADLRTDPRVAEVVDIGVNLGDAPEAFAKPYPYVGIAAGELIRDGQADRAILFCGTGIGVAIAANKVDGIRAATAHDSFSVERSVLSNNCQVLTMGQRGWGWNWHGGWRGSGSATPSIRRPPRRTRSRCSPATRDAETCPRPPGQARARAPGPYATLTLIRCTTLLPMPW